MRVSGISSPTTPGVVDINSIASSARVVLEAGINVCDPTYGCVGDGVTNDWTGFKAACDALHAAGSGRLFVPPNKNIYLNPGTAQTPARIPPNTDPAKRFVYECLGGSHIKLSANMPACFQPARTADHQTWRGIDFIDWAVDRNNVDTAENVIFGATDATGGIGTLSQRANLRDIRFIRPRAWNVPANGSGGPAIGVIGLWVRHVYTNEADTGWSGGNVHSGAGYAQNTVLDIVLEQPQFDGGDYGFICGANLGKGQTNGMRVKNFSGTTVNWVSSASSQPALAQDDWIYIGTGKYFERKQITAKTDNGDGTGSITINSALSFSHPTEDATGAGLGSPMVLGSTCNVWFDRIHVDGQHGYIASGTGGYSSNILYVGHGIGGHDLSVKNITLSGSGDNALEVDTALGFKAEKVHAIDSANQGFLSRNFNVPQTQQNYSPQEVQQHHEYVDCLAQGETVHQSAGGFLVGYNWNTGHVAGAHAKFGTVKLRNCRVVDRTANFRTSSAGFAEALTAGLDSSITRIEGDITYEKFNMSDSSASAPRIVTIRPNTDCTVDLKVVASLHGSSGAGYQPTVVDLAAYNPKPGGFDSNHHYNVEAELRSTVSSAPAGSHHLFDVGALSSSANLGTHHGKLTGRFLDAWTSADSSPKGVVFSSNMATGRIGGTITLDDWDTQRVSAAQPFVFPSSATWLRMLVFGHNNNVNGTVLSHALPNLTADYTATIADRFLPVDATSANRTITLPAVTALPLHHILTVKKVDASANTVTVDGNASETLDGATTKVLSAQYDSVTILNTGSAWLVI